jgi:hypothetical protein
MKYLFYSFGFWFLISCQNQQESPQQLTPEPEQKKQDLILGDWNMDSSVFINDGVRGVVSAPLMPTIWNFGEDGSYLVKNSVSMTGTFSRTADSLFVVLMAVPNEYEILVLNETNLHLRSTIIQTDSASMKTDAYLSRK